MFSFFKRLGRRAPSEFTIIEKGDAAIVEAVANARESLPVFWSVFDAQTADDYQLKAGLDTPNGAVEHLWFIPRARSDSGKVVGILTVQPRDIEGLNEGDEVFFPEDRISDWSYRKGDLLYGMYTQRALLDRLPPQSRREMEAALSPTPLESGAS